MTEFNDGNEYHFIVDPQAYARQRLMYEYRVYSGTSGSMQLDKRFAEQRSLMQPLLDALLYYHKPDNRSSPENQGNMFCDRLGSLQANEMVMLDTELNCGLDDYTDFMRRWCDVVEKRLNTYSWIYVPLALSDQLTRAVTGQRIVKAPAYSGTSDRGRTPWWDHDVHQYTDKGYFPGANGPGDSNYTEMSVPDMLARCRRSQPAIPEDLIWNAILEQMVGVK